MSKFCTNCGQELNETVKFCLNCGQEINKDEKNINENIVSTNSDSTNYNKSKIAAGLLGIFLGSLGVHNFYLGRTGRAVAQLLITILSCFLLSFISGIWSLIESILILCGNVQVDGNGNPLRD